METLKTLTYERTERVARITLNRPSRGNGITAQHAARARRVCRTRQPRSRGSRDRAVRKRQRFLRRLRPGRKRGSDPRQGGRDKASSRAPRSTRCVQMENHTPGAHLGSDDRLRDDEPQCSRLHESLSQREAGRVQSARLLRRGRHRHGPVLRPFGDRRRREDRLSARARLGRADDGAVGSPHRTRKGQAPAFHRRLSLGQRGRRVGSGDRIRAGRSARSALRGACSRASPECRSINW